jgi:hypothetical protein
MVGMLYSRFPNLLGPCLLGHCVSRAASAIAIFPDGEYSTGVKLTRLRSSPDVCRCSAPKRNGTASDARDDAEDRIKPAHPGSDPARSDRAPAHSCNPEIGIA